MKVEVDGVEFQVAGLANGAVRVRDVSRALGVGDDNDITITGLGKPGGSAVVLVSE